MAMTEFEKKMLKEMKGINKELHELNRALKKDTPNPTQYGPNLDEEVSLKVNGDHVSEAMRNIQKASVANMVRGNAWG